MQQIKQGVTQSLVRPQDSWGALRINCTHCMDSGSISKADRRYSCRCEYAKRARKFLTCVPPIFRSPKLSRLEPRPDLHPLQAKVITCIKTHPNDSYLLTGKNGVGKSHFSWALYRHAVLKRRPTVACTVRDLLEQFRKQELTRDTNNHFRPSVTRDNLAQFKQRYFIFLDEIDKARPSEFSCEMLFDLLDAAKSFGHQLVVTSNLTIQELRQHWSRQNRMWGDSIVERLRACYIAEMF